MGKWMAVTPGFVLSNTKLSSSAKIVYGAISSYSAAGKKMAFPSHAQIAERAGLNVRSIPRLVKELVNAGYIIQHRRGCKKTNTYEVITHQCDVTQKCNQISASSDIAEMSNPSIKRILKNSTSCLDKKECPQEVPSLDQDFQEGELIPKGRLNMDLLRAAGLV